MIRRRYAGYRLMKVWWIIILALGLVGTTAFIPVVKTTQGATTVTGITLTTEAWLGLPAVSRKQASPLANWCQTHGVTVTEDTVFFSKITKSVWSVSRGCGHRPAICDFTPAMQKEWLARTSDTEVRRFIEAMMASDETGRSHLVEATVAQLVK